MICQMVGQTEIAEMLGVKRQTVRMWNHRGMLPEPHQVLAAGPIWRAETIVTWAKQTGRLK